jgi:hypothetical protein
MLLDGSGPVIGRLSIKRSTNLAFSPAPRTGGRDTDRGRATSTCSGSQTRSRNRHCHDPNFGQSSIPGAQARV